MRVDRMSGRPVDDEFAEEIDAPFAHRLAKFREMAEELRRIEPLERDEGRNTLLHGTLEQVREAGDALRSGLDHEAASFSREELKEIEREALLSDDELKLLEHHRNRARRRTKARTRDRLRD